MVREIAMAGLLSVVFAAGAGVRGTAPKMGERGDLAIAAGGAATCAIVIADDASAAEQTAAVELVAYLERVTGGEFAIVKEGQALKPGPRMYLGPTQFAREQGIDCARLGAEQWVMRTVDGSLVLAGGRPRGTLYAVYWN